MKTSPTLIALTSLLAVSSLGIAGSSLVRARRAEAELASARLEIAAEFRELRRLLQERGEGQPDGSLLAPVMERRESREAAVDDAVPEASSEATRLAEVEPRLLDRFSSLGSDAREDALEILADLARLGDEKALELILNSLSDEDAGVREEAVECIDELADPALIGHLEGLVGDEAPDVREEVADALSDMHAEQAGPILERMLDDANPDVIAEALDSLRSLDYEAAVPKIAGLADSDDLDLVARAAATLRRMDQPDLARYALGRLATGLDSHDALDRINAIHRVRRVGGAEARAFLERILAQDDNVSVRLEAQRALARLRG